MQEGRLFEWAVFVGIIVWALVHAIVMYATYSNESSPAFVILSGLIFVALILFYVKAVIMNGRKKEEP